MQDLLRIEPWPDPVIDTLGFDPRSWYVEHFWLPTLGPTATWFLRRVAEGFDAHPDGFDLDLESTARGLGLGGLNGRHGPFNRAMSRCVVFGLATKGSTGALYVRRRVPRIPLRMLQRLPSELVDLHQRFFAARRHISHGQFAST